LLNPFVDVTVVVLWPLAPWRIVKDVGLRLTLKSGAWRTGGCDGREEHILLLVTGDGNTPIVHVAKCVLPNAVA